jgi:hypothetical protein
MTRSYEPDADRQLDEGSEPPAVCHCGRLIDDGDWPQCAKCEDAEQMAEFDAAHPVQSWADEERESARNY